MENIQLPLTCQQMLKMLWAKGWTNARIARAVGMSEAGVHKVVRGKTKSPSEALNLALHRLLMGL